MATLVDNSPPYSLVDLPEELSLAIIEQLDMASIFALSRTYRQFHRLANPADPSRREKRLDFLFEAQAFPRWLDPSEDDGFACFHCAKVLPRNDFTCNQTVSVRGRRASPDQQRLRFCV